MVIASYLINKAREKGYAEGYPVGYAQGYPVGYAQGYPVGYAQGYPVGYAQGYPVGYAQGLAEGRTEAYEDANKQLDAYFKRMDVVREKGETFDEPPPMFGNNRR